MLKNLVQLMIWTYVKFLVKQFGVMEGNTTQQPLHLKSIRLRGAVKFQNTENHKVFIRGAYFRLRFFMLVNLMSTIYREKK